MSIFHITLALDYLNSQFKEDTGVWGRSWFWVWIWVLNFFFSARKTPSSKSSRKMDVGKCQFFLLQSQEKLLQKSPARQVFCWVLFTPEASFLFPSLLMHSRIHFLPTLELKVISGVWGSSVIQILHSIKLCLLGNHLDFAPKVWEKGEDAERMVVKLSKGNKCERERPVMKKWWTETERYTTCFPALITCW